VIYHIIEDEDYRIITIIDLGPRQTGQVKTELIEEIARKVKAELSHLVLISSDDLTCNAPII
jgi:hypothetical protein